MQQIESVSPPRHAACSIASRYEPGKCLSWKLPPALSGEVAVENLEVTNLAVHQHVSAQIHEQLKDVPDGTTIKFVRTT